MYHFIMLDCAAATNTFYVSMPYDALLKGATWVAGADPGANKTMVLSHDTAGATIVSGDISATAGTAVVGTVTATLADANLVLNSTTAPLKIVATTSNACKVCLTLDIDEFVRPKKA